MPYTASVEQKREEAQVEVLAARYESQKWLDYAKRVAHKWGLEHLDISVKFWQ